MSETMTGQEFLMKLKEQSAEKKADFADFSDFIEKKARIKGVPVRGQFELTPLCNFSCRMCYVHLSGSQLGTRTVLKPEQWKDLMHQAWEAGMIRATLTGGECLAYPGFEELYLYLHSLGCEIMILTNGALLDQERVEFLKEHKPASIGITLYGNNEDAYERVTGQRAFGTVMDNIRRVKEADIPFGITVTPSVYLGEDVFDTLRLARKLSPTILVNAALNPPRGETGRAGQEHDVDLDFYSRIFKLDAELKGYTVQEYSGPDLPEPGGPSREPAEKGFLCGAGRSGFSIDWEGYMHPCTDLGMITASPLKIGFLKSWEFIHHEAENWVREPACSGCPYNTVCKQCAADLIRHSKPGGKPEAWCRRTVQLVRHGIWQLPDCE